MKLKSPGSRTLVLAFCCLFARPAFSQSARAGWGSLPYHDASGTGVTFRVWAPNALSVYVPGEFNGWSTTLTPLAKEFPGGTWNGVWSADVTTASPGSQYKYFINYSGGNVWKHDPRSRLVTFSGSAVGANDIIYDPSAFNWQGDSLTPPRLDDLVVYELHIGTFGAGGSASRFSAAINQLDYLKNLGVNAIEVMPLAEFPGDNSWGYNLAQPFAVENIAYGGADGFKTFVQACHLRGLAVLVDVVHNHYGPGDLDMWNFDGWTGGGPIGGGIYFYQSNTNLEKTPYGDTRPNFSSQQVRNFIQDNFTMWLSEYHVDGFRWDTPGLMMNANGYGYIADAGSLINSINTMIHSQYSGKISISEDVYKSFGFDSAWDTTYPYSFTPVLTNAVDANRNMNVISNAVLYNVRYGSLAGPARIAFLESHDVVGDLNHGARLASAIDPGSPNSFRARKLSTLGAAVTMTAPGVPMLFQGQEMLENQQFSSSRSVDWSKTNTYSGIVRFYRDLIRARRNLDGHTPGLEGNACAMLKVDNVSKLIAFHRWKTDATNQDAVVIANFSGTALNNYAVNFPSAGTWYVHVNSDSNVYGADYGNFGGAVVNANGNPASGNVTIGPYTALILSQTPPAPPQLSITGNDGMVTLSWPSVYGSWVLYRSSSLNGTPVWIQVPPVQYQVNGSSIYVTTAASAGASFYRLQQH